MLLVEVALSDSSAGSGRDFGVLEVVTTEAGTLGEIRLSFILVKDNLNDFRVQRTDNCENVNSCCLVLA